jgi:hypothetical protein
LRSKSKQEKIIGGVVVVEVNHNPFAMDLIAVAISHRCNTRRLNRGRFIFVPVSKRPTNRFVMVVIQNFKTKPSREIISLMPYGR